MMPTQDLKDTVHVRLGTLTESRVVDIIHVGREEHSVYKTVYKTTYTHRKACGWW